MSELPPSNPLRSDLADRLNEASVAQVVEYLAHRLLDGGSGFWTLRFEVQQGKLRRGEIIHGQIGVDEIEKMGDRERRG